MTLHLLTYSIGPVRHTLPLLIFSYLFPPRFSKRHFLPVLKSFTAHVDIKSIGRIDQCNCGNQSPDCVPIAFPVLAASDDALSLADVGRPPQERLGVGVCEEDVIVDGTCGKTEVEKVVDNSDVAVSEVAIVEAG